MYVSLTPFSFQRSGDNVTQTLRFTPVAADAYTFDIFVWGSLENVPLLVDKQVLGPVIVR